MYRALAPSHLQRMPITSIKLHTGEKHCVKRWCRLSSHNTNRPTWRNEEGLLLGTAFMVGQLSLWCVNKIIYIILFHFLNGVLILVTYRCSCRHWKWLKCSWIELTNSHWSPFCMASAALDSPWGPWFLKLHDIIQSSSPSKRSCCGQENEAASWESQACWGSQ